MLQTRAGYRLDVRRIRDLGNRSGVAEISEHVEVDGAPRDHAEAILFDFDDAGRIVAIDIYVKREKPGIQ